MTINKCPHCGGRIELNIKPVGGYPKRPAPDTSTLHSTSRTPFKNDAVAIPSVSPGYQQESQSATFLPTTEANVIVPFLQAVITGVFIGVPVGLLVGLIDVKLDTLVIRGSIGSGLLWGAVTVFSVTFWQWISRSGEYNNLLWRIETITGMDVNGDEEVGQPEPPTVRVEVREGHTWRFANLPGSDEALQAFARDVLNGIRTFSEQGANDNGYGVDNFKKLRALFIEKGWAAWNHPTHKQQGIRLTRSGEWLVREIAGTPLPYRDAHVQKDGVDAGGSTQYEKFTHI